MQITQLLALPCRSTLYLFIFFPSQIFLFELFGVGEPAEILWPWLTSAKQRSRAVAVFY